jgi:hypothetical protein
MANKNTRPPLSGFHAKEDVFRHACDRHQAEFLIDDTDAIPQGIRGLSYYGLRT